MKIILTAVVLLFMFMGCAKENTEQKQEIKQEVKQEEVKKTEEVKTDVKTEETKADVKVDETTVKAENGNTEVKTDAGTVEVKTNGGSDLKIDTKEVKLSDTQPKIIEKTEAEKAEIKKQEEIKKQAIVDEDVKELREKADEKSGNVDELQKDKAEKAAVDKKKSVNDLDSAKQKEIKGKLENNKRSKFDKMDEF